MHTDLNRGLTSEQVRELTEKGLSNRPVENQSKTVGQIIASNLFTYFNLIFAIFGVLLVLVHSYRDMSFLPIIIANTMIGIIQEIRSKKVLDKLTVLNAPKANVVRNGVKDTVNAEELVVGDIVSFSAGNQICADAVVADGEVQVNESLITGESDEITKRKGDKLLSGSFIVSGECKAELEKVGYESYVSKLTLEAKTKKKSVQSEMMNSLNKLVNVIGILLIPIGITLFAEQHFMLDYTVKDSVVATIAALVGMIPEGLYLLASVALVVSVMRLARKKVLVHEMACIETLARVNVLCVDKTGTITENTMEVNEIIPLDSDKDMTFAIIHQKLKDFVFNMTSDNITMDALKKYFNGGTEKKAISTTSFSSAYKYSSATFEDGAYVLGAPEFVLREQYEDYRKIIEKYSQIGYRVLVYGLYEGNIDGKALTANIHAMALILISNPVRKEAKSTFQYFASQGVEIKVISGDNPVTVSNVAAMAGISNADNFIDASTLQTEEQVREAMKKYTVFGRVTPNQKREFVRALKENGKTVAMTGDGVNDVLALKDADCSIAMASGSEAAANAAQLVLLESDFACMPSVVYEGRRVVNNIQRSASLFLIKNIFSMLLAIFSLIFALKYPLVPAQLSMLGLFTIGIPAFLLAMQPNKSIIRGHFLTNVLLRALPAGITDFVVVATLALISNELLIPAEQLSTIAIAILLSVGMVTLLRVCMPFNKLRASICLSMLLGIILCVLFVPRFFALYALDKTQWIVLVIFITVSIPFLAIVNYIIDKIIAYETKHNKRFRKKLGL